MPLHTNYRNQEELERVKKDIEEQKNRKSDLEMGAERTMGVLQSIKEALIEMLLRLQELDEMTAEIQAKRKLARPPISLALPDLVSGNVSTEQIVKMLEEKVKVGMIASGQFTEGIDSGLSEDESVEQKPIIEEDKTIEEVDELEREMKVVKSPSVTNFAIDEKPSAYPQVYSSLITGRSTGLVSSASPGAGGGAGSEEEADVPSRSFLKRQANLILDAKSRRKFRQQQAPARRK
jgi:coiled-coil domain-containing protein 151